jgi:hypothetical protein
LFILFFPEKGSALGISGDEQKEVFALTTTTITTTGKSPTVSKKRVSQNSISPHRKKTEKKSTTYDRHNEIDLK